MTDVKFVGRRVAERRPSVRPRDALANAPNVPLYARVFQTLRDEILTGFYDSSGKLPAEFAIENRFLVSRITVRRAVDELQRAGLVMRSQGRPTEILPRPPALVVDVGREIESHKAEGIDMQPLVLTFTWLRPDASLAESLMLDGPDEKVLWVTRLRRRLGQPVSHTSAHMPERIGRLVSRDALNHHQLIDILRQQGQVAASADQILTAAPASHAIAELLDLPVGAPLFCLRRLTRDSDGRPMVLLNSSLRWDRFSYRMDMRQAASLAMPAPEAADELIYSL
ncbi:GntR family transcriptional regulator [Acidisoma cellulosilytica]|uniref:GntR family transcriptional regulator n=1 Tax=Acidisoma cellulosilyticum TaxID=2802395 RepID=A0A963Z225_9PROT|nr:GntR family transcriptional regulator [Acidisoma cellulosilyticum]MCB8881422.1 GntR family transcriptional regulator [Acidisoma cellulosilyticum]